ncbi:WXG100 family type VII secretion target [Nocardia tenerifensis]|uniref:ESAT-6-like protein n=1 Tax=Nocardia tenerifensis TaxID=228006 RepID=A0A318K4I4_9NOCA|nr:WXG100 family type VII secretion target [Nocardia tenerifensis]PXX66579.1 WXG100 family type VII secretion target [Nocardia tenerifensis]
MALTSLGGGSDAVGLEAGGISKVVSDLQDAITNLRNSVNQIDQAAQDAKNGWKGQASDKFNQVADAWNDEAKDLNQKLNAFSEAVDQGSKQLQSMDEV